MELAAFGVDHPEVGAALAEQWNLPALLVVPIRYHETPEAAGEDVRGLVRTVALGNRVAEIFLNEDDRGSAVQIFRTELIAWFDVHSTSVEQLRPALDEALAHRGPALVEIVTDADLI